MAGLFFGANKQKILLITLPKGVGQHAGMAGIRKLPGYLRVGQHAGINPTALIKRWEMLPFYTLGQHAGMMGQHKKEWWVNMKGIYSETQTATDMMVFSRYYHLYWIPVFPFDKNATTICNKCGLKSSGRPFDQKLISNFQEVKGKYKHHWWSYSLSAIFIGVVLLFIFG